jgi:hypothetical protein
MLIFKISQTINKEFNTYSSAIVVASSVEEARLTHPDDDFIWNADLGRWCWVDDFEQPGFSNAWANPEDVNVEFIGIAHSPGRRVLCSSFDSR